MAFASAARAAGQGVVGAALGLVHAALQGFAMAVCKNSHSPADYVPTEPKIRRRCGPRWRRRSRRLTDAFNKKSFQRLFSKRWKLLF